MMMEKTVKFQIVNIVASTSINQKLDLNKIKNEFSRTEFNPDKYFALIFRVTRPKLSILVNWSGKIIFTGARSIDDIFIARHDFFRELKKIGYFPEESEIKIQNMVINVNIGKKVVLERIFECKKNLNIEYEPEIFPGIIFKNENPQFTALIFQSGKIVITGIRDLSILDKCIKTTQNLLL